MNKQVEQLKKDLNEVKDAINAFQSETVQVIVIDRVLDHLISRNRSNETDIELAIIPIDLPTNPISKMQLDLKVNTADKKVGSTKILNQLLDTDFCDTPRSIASITDFCATQYDTVFQTSQVSGVLLGLINANKLSRIISEETNRFLYLKPII